jgi:hypothetical protein
MKIEFFRWWLFICLLSIGAYFGIHFDIFSTIFNTDKTYLSSVILLLFTGSTLLTGYRTWLFNYRKTYTDTKVGWFCGEVMFALGMIGTLIGFVLVFGDALAHIDLEDQANKAKIIADMGIGISTAIYTTLAGLVCTILLWIQLINLEYGFDHHEEE